MKAALLLDDGFEDAEAIITYDILRRLGIEVELVACHERMALTSYFGLKLEASATLGQVRQQLYDALILPGGPAATRALAANAEVLALIRRHDEAGKWLCALCSAPARVLAANHLLRGRRYSCCGDLWQDAPDGVYQADAVVVDGNLITGKGLGVAFDFALTVAARLLGNEAPSREQAAHIDYMPYLEKAAL